MNRYNKKQSEKCCPLKPTEWIQFLNNTDSRLIAFCDYHHSSVLSEMVIELAITSIVLLFVTLIYIVFSSKDSLFNLVYFILIALFLSFEFKVIRKFRRMFNKLGKGINNISAQIDEIVEDIIDGELTDTNEIRKRYREIEWENFSLNF